ncbi:hypothetical protein ABGR48_001870 [Shigella sonnei]|nr:hypothetical protein [Shigella sonnei]EJT4832311.1 hypothetical protein [Escherichia coli]EFP6018908.1 hypothetical protein [Shigella sonnei]EFP6991062.1 hypothetical protein [Shigella sonnei]EFP7138202.1 hypothetical protein [Shigella sonnei]
MFRLPTPRLLSGLKSALRPAMPRFKVSAFWLLILAWIFLLVWIWWKGPMWTLYEEQWLKPLAGNGGVGDYCPGVAYRPGDEAPATA